MQGEKLYWTKKPCAPLGFLNHPNVSFLLSYPPTRPTAQNSLAGTAFRDLPKMAGRPEPAWPLCPTHLVNSLSDMDGALLQG